MSRVCNKHGIPEYCPDGVCRWCPPPALAVVSPLVKPTPFAEAARAMIMRAYKDAMLKAADAPLPPPLPIATCLHDGAFFQLDGTNYSCVTCGKVFTPDGQKTATEAAILAGYGLN